MLPPSRKSTEQNADVVTTKTTSANSTPTFFTFCAASLTVNTNVEKTGGGCLACTGHASSVAPIGKQNKGTDGGNGKLIRSVSGYLDNIAAKITIELHIFIDILRSSFPSRPYLVYTLLLGLGSSIFCNTETHRSRPFEKFDKLLLHIPKLQTDIKRRIPTIPLFRFLFMIQKACGGDSPLLATITHTSVTTNALQHIVGCARRYVTYVLADELLTLADRPDGVCSNISESGKICSFPSYIILRKSRNT